MRWILAALAAWIAYTACTPHQQPYRWDTTHATINQQEGDGR